MPKLPDIQSRREIRKAPPSSFFAFRVSSSSRPERDQPQALWVIRAFQVPNDIHASLMMAVAPGFCLPLQVRILTDHHNVKFMKPRGVRIPHRSHIHLDNVFSFVPSAIQDPQSWLTECTNRPLERRIWRPCARVSLPYFWSYQGANRSAKLFVEAAMISAWMFAPT